MAEGLAKHLLAEHLEIPVEQLPAAGYNVISAGTFGFDGLPVSPESVQALQTQGIDISEYTSAQLTETLIQQADLIFCMTESHRQTVIHMMPEAASKTHCLLADQDVDDPIGMGLSAYQKTAEMIRIGIQQRLSEIL